MRHMRGRNCSMLSWPLKQNSEDGESRLCSGSGLSRFCGILYRFLRNVGFSGQELHRTVKNLSEAAERSSNWL